MVRGAFMVNKKGLRRGLYLIRLNLFMCAFFGGICNIAFGKAKSASKNTITIVKIDRSTNRIVLNVEKASIEEGDFLQILDKNSFEKCKVGILKKLKGRALASIYNCGFSVSKDDKVRSIDIEDQLLKIDLVEDDLLKTEFHYNERDISSSGSNSMIEINREDYVTGGVLGTIFGLGIGHAVQGRWSTRGWAYTLGGIGSYWAMINAMDSETCGYVDDGYGTLEKVCTNANNSTTGLWALLFLVVRIGEIVDVWSPSSKKYKIVKNKKKYDFFVTPVLKNRYAGVTLGLSF